MERFKAALMYNGRHLLRRQYVRLKGWLTLGSIVIMPRLILAFVAVGALAATANLIVENGVADAFRPLIVVSAPEEVQVARACKRDSSTPEEARARIRAQMSLADKVKVADFVIENTGSLADLERAYEGGA